MINSRLSSLGRQRHATGEIVNYLSVDAYRLGEFPWYVHQIWTTPLQVIVASAILFYTVGWATVGGLAIIVITMICNTPLAHALQRSQVQLMRAQDERLRASTEILNSIKIIKLQAWEDNYCEKVMKIRQNEFYWLSSSLYKRSLGTILFWMTPVFVSTVTFGAYILLGHQLSPAIVFTSLAAFRIVQDPVRVVPELLAIIIQVQVSLGRLSQFLQDNELQDKAVDQHHSEDYVVEIQDAVLSWDPLASKPTLPSINLKIMPGNHVAVCGSVGSGKSTLLYSIMGEIPKVSGSVSPPLPCRTLLIFQFSVQSVSGNMP
jgi:ABC-type bacteriocin/lantibiotic exporter with double-glycine peptidase domain